MARLFGSGRWSFIAIGGLAKTGVQLLPAANQRVAVVGYGVGFEDNSEPIPSTVPPVVVDLLSQSDSGNMQILTLNKYDPSLTEAIQTVGRRTSSSDPTPDVIRRTFTVNFQGSIFVRDAQDDEIIIGGGVRFGLQVLAEKNVQCATVLEFEE